MNKDTQKEKVKLTESQLRQMITECVNEAMMEEGLWDQIKQGAASFFGNGYGKNSTDKDGNLKNYRNSVRNRQERGEHTANPLNGSIPLNLKRRWNAAKTGFKEQGNVDGANNVIKSLQSLIKSGDITPEMSVKQVMNKMTGNRLSAQNKVSRANNDIYKGMETGVMGSGKRTRI